MARDDVVFQIVEGQTPTDTSSVEYLPYGVKILKLLVRRHPVKKPQLGPIWIRPENYRRPDVDSPEPQMWRAYGTADDDPHLWVAWGAGDEQGFCVKTTEKFPADKVPAPLDDDGSYYVYLHLIHRPPEPLQQPLGDKALTVQAVDQEGTVHGEMVVSLAAPAGAANAARAQWQWRLDSDGESVITLAATPGGPGIQIPRYVSRWWPPNGVTYVAPNAHEQTFLEEMSIAYRRRAGGTDKSEMHVVWDAETLAHISGDLALPLHDCRLVSVELFRFPDDFHLVLRLWFYWVNLRFDEGELLAFVPPGKRPSWRAEAQRVQQELAAGLLPYHKDDEIPDLERLDLLINPQSRSVTHVGTDTHWQEFWATVEDQPLQASIASWKEIHRVALQAKKVPRIESPVLNPLSNGLCPIINDGRAAGEEISACPHRPEGHVVTAEDLFEEMDYAVCPGCGTHFIGAVERAVGIIGKHAPVLRNARVIRNAVSNNVLNG